MTGSFTVLALLGALAAPSMQYDFDAPTLSARTTDPRGYFLSGPDPAANLFEQGTGSVEITASDRVKGSATFGDKATVRAEFRLGNDTYRVTLDQPGFPPQRLGGTEKAPWPVGGGVLTNTWVDGVTGRGSRYAPSSLAAIAIYGLGRVERNGELLSDKAELEVLALSRGYHADDASHRVMPEARKADAEIVIRVNGLPREKEPRGFLEFSFDEVQISDGAGEPAVATVPTTGTTEPGAPAPSGVGIGGGYPVGTQGTAYGLPTALGVGGAGAAGAVTPAPAAPTNPNNAQPTATGTAPLQPAPGQTQAANLPTSGTGTTAAQTGVPAAGTQLTTPTSPPSPYASTSGFADTNSSPGTTTPATGGGATGVASLPGVTSSPANPELQGRTGALAPTVAAGAYVSTPSSTGVPPPTSTTVGVGGQVPTSPLQTATVTPTASGQNASGTTAVVAPGDTTVTTSAAITVPGVAVSTTNAAGVPSVTGFTPTITGAPTVTGAPSMTTSTAGTPTATTVGQTAAATAPIPGTTAALTAPTMSGFYSPGLQGTPQPLNAQPAQPLPRAEPAMNSQSAFGTPLLSTPAPLNAAAAGPLPTTPATTAAPAVTPGTAPATTPATTR